MQIVITMFIHCGYQLRPEKKASDAALQSMTQNVQARLEVKMHKGSSRAVSTINRQTDF